MVIPEIIITNIIGHDVRIVYKSFNFRWRVDFGTESQFRPVSILLKAVFAQKLSNQLVQLRLFKKLDSLVKLEMEWIP